MIIVSGCGSENKWVISGNISHDLNTLLDSGVSTFNIMNGVEQSQRQIELNEKFKNGISKHPEWLQTYMGELNLKSGELLPYHENFGMTESEYDELLTYINLSLIHI